MKRLDVNTVVLVLLLGLISNAALATPIPVTNVTASSYYSLGTTNMPPDNTTNGSGLDGIFPNQTHDTNFENMWMTNEGNDVAGDADGIESAWIQFDLGAVYNLASAHIWNFNQYTEIPDDPASPFDLTNRGIQYADIFVSLDSANWTPFAENFFFPRAPGVSSYPGFDLEFGGTLARYVKFEIDSNYEDDPGNNPGAGNYVGLSEVQFMPAPVPEPATMFLLGSGLIGIGAFVRRKFKR